MQGSSAATDRVLLDAAALCGHLVPAGSVYAFLAEHRQRISADSMWLVCTDRFERPFDQCANRHGARAREIACRSKCAGQRRVRWHPNIAS